MSQKIKIGSYETSCLILNMVSYKVILMYPRNVAEYAGNAGWMVTLLGAFLVLILFLIQNKLYKKFSGQDILDVSEKALGEPGRIITGLLLISYFLIIVSVILREFVEDFKVISLSTTPTSFITILFCVGMIIGAYLGLESIARIHALVVPVIAIAFLLVLALSIPKFDIDNLTPWLGLGPKKIFENDAFHFISSYSEIIVLFLIVPFLKKKNEFGTIGRYSLIACGFILLVGTLSYMLTYQYPISTEYFLPLYTLSRSIRFSRFFTRIESAFILIWASSAFLFLSSCLYFVVYLFQKAFGLKYKKPLILPFAVLIFTFSMIPESLSVTIQIQTEFYRKYAWILTILLPIILLSIASARNKSAKNKEIKLNDKKKISLNKN